MTLKIRPKLILMFLIVGMLPMGVVAWYGNINATDSLMKQSFNQLDSIRKIKKSQIERYFSEREGDMGVLVKTVQTLRTEAFNKLAAVQKIKKEQLAGYINAMKNQIILLKDDDFV